MEQGMLRTFGRVMPVLMPLGAVLALALAIISWSDRGSVFWLRCAATVAIAVTIFTTLTTNVPINSLTAAWRLSDDPAEWTRLRAKWHVFQSVRGGLFLAAFAVLALAMAARSEA
jgi:uncharacterized membrane protein